MVPRAPPLGPRRGGDRGVRGAEALIAALEPPVLRVLAGLFVALGVGSGIRWFLLRNADEEVAGPLRASLGVWWAILGGSSAALAIGRWGVALFLATASAVGTSEFFRLTGVGRRAPGLAREGIALAAGGHLLVVGGGVDLFLVGYPALALLWLGGRLVIRGGKEGFISLAGSWLLGVLLVGYGLAHAVVPYGEEALRHGEGALLNPVGGAAGWLLLFLVLAQMNDILQSLVGRRIGRRPIARVLSPRKTWEGFLGGLLGTAVLGSFLGPFLSPLGPLTGAGVGGAVAVAGFVGDVTISGVKRDAGVKDSGRSLPGHGGVLDRIDSLLLSAPLFHHLIRLLG